MNTKIKINGVDYTNKCTMPIQEQKTADDSLDAGYLELISIDKEKPFSPFSSVEINKNDGIKTETENYYIASDESNEMIKNNKFNHDIVLIEETKEMERYIVNTKTSTNPIVHDYLSNKKKVMVAGVTTEFWFFPDSKYIEFDLLSPREINQAIEIKRPYNLLMEYFTKTNYTFINTVSTDYNDVVLTITAPDGTEVMTQTDSCSSAPASSTFMFTPTQAGDYKFTLVANGKAGGIGNVDASFNLAVVSAITPKQDKTVKNVCEVLLQTCESLRASETPRFSLAQVNDYDESKRELITKLYAKKAPEFAFTKCTLFEAFKEIGDFIHAIPRLKNKKVFFDLLGTDEECSVDLEKYNQNTQTQSIDNFCSELDMNVDNLIDADNDAGGSITEPFVNGFKTVRVETGTAQITEDGMIISTEYPIYDIIKLEAGVLSNGTPIGDITPFVYESAEYQTLSSSSNTFPTSRMFALKFTQGQKNITQLNFKNEHLITDAFENYSLMNIIYKKLGIETNWWKNFWNNEDIYNLQFRVTYTPMVSARIKQTKENVSDLAFKTVLTYNQSANMVSATALGENLKGAVAKYGVPEKKLMLTFSKLAEVPKVNTKYKGFTITSVKTETYNNHILAEIGMSKKFNNKSAYISINSQKRYYEVSEKASYARFDIHENYCLIGDSCESKGSTLLTTSAITAFKNSFTDGKLNNVGVVKAQGFTADNTALQEIARPVIALGVGNSIVFKFSYEDNYSAGNTASYSGKTKIQDYAKYVDPYGEIEKLKVSFGKVKEIEYSYNLAKTTGDLFPLGTSLPANHWDILFTTGDDPLVLKKDSREQISLSYQIHFIATPNRPNIRIGSGIGRKNTFTSKENLNYKLYILPNEINEFAHIIDLTNAKQVNFTVTESATNQIKIADITATANGKAWALVNVGTTNELIVGENITIKNGEEVSLPYFTFTRKLEIKEE